MKKKIITIALLAVGLTACKKDFLSLEVNPNSPSVTTPQFTLSGALKIAADISNTSTVYNPFGVWSGQWSPSGNYVPSPQLQQYNFVNTDYAGTFGSLYQNATNFNLLTTSLGADPANANFKAIGMIMKAYDFEALVDIYNDVPYSQAFDPTILSPKYDKGQDIYADLVIQLDNAIKLINASASATNPGPSDIAFQGDMTKWKKFANTLKLRLAVRQSNLSGGTAKAALAATAGEGYIDLTFNGAVNPGYANSDALGGQESPFWRVYGFDQSGNLIAGSNDYYRANAFEVGLLKATTDPRLSKIYAPLADGVTVTGVVFGSIGTQNPASSAIGPGLLKSPTMDAVILSSAQSLFLQAEAAARGYIPGDAAGLYKSGILASFRALGLADADFNTYYTANAGVKNVDFAAAAGLEQQIEAIVTQKYIAVTGYEKQEAFYGLKRTGYPVGVPRSVDPKAIGTGIPNRTYYPNTEYSNNAINVAAEGTIDPFSSKIFWQK